MNGRTLSTKELVRRLEEVEKRLASREIDAEAICVRRKGEKRMVIIAADLAGHPGVAVFDDDGVPRVQFGLRNDGKALFLMSNREGHVGLEIQTQPDGSTGLLLRDKNNKVRVDVMVDEDGGAIVGIFDKQGMPRSWMGGAEGESANVAVVPTGSKKATLLVPVPDEGARDRLLDAVLRMAKTKGVH